MLHFKNNVPNQVLNRAKESCYLRKHGGFWNVLVSFGQVKESFGNFCKWVSDLQPDALHLLFGDKASFFVPSEVRAKTRT